MLKISLRTFLFYCSLSSISFFLISCAQGGLQDTHATVPTEAQLDQTLIATEPEPKELTILTGIIAQSRYYNGLQQMITKLEEEENIIIELDVIPDDQYTVYMKERVLAGEAPDLIDYNIPGIYYELNPETYFVNLSEEPWVKNLIVPDNISYNGQIYGYPFQSIQGVFGYIYNKELFDNLHIKVPTTWEELLEVCELIKSECGDTIAPIYLAKDSWVPQIYMTANFATALGSEGSVNVGNALESNKLKWTDIPEFYQVINRYLDLFKQGYINENYYTATYEDMITAMGTGQAAMVFCGDFFASSVLQTYPSANLDMFDVRMAGSHDVIAATTQSVGFVISNTSPNIEVAKRVFQLWSTPDYGDLYYKNRTGFPALKFINGGSTPIYLSSLNMRYIAAGKCIEEFNNALTVGSNVVQTHLWPYFITAPQTGLNAEQILKAFQKDYEKYMRSINHPNF